MDEDSKFRTPKTELFTRQDKNNLMYENLLESQILKIPTFEKIQKNDKSITKKPFKKLSENYDDFIMNIKQPAKSVKRSKYGFFSHNKIS